MGLLRKLFGGQTMAALTAGTKAPDFTLKSIEGKEFSLSEQLAHGPVVLAFFKVSCSTCQYAFPFFERLYKAYGQNGVKLVGILKTPRAKPPHFKSNLALPSLCCSMNWTPIPSRTPTV